MDEKTARKLSEFWEWMKQRKAEAEESSSSDGIAESLLMDECMGRFTELLGVEERTVVTFYSEVDDEIEDQRWRMALQRRMIESG